MQSKTFSMNDHSIKVNKANLNELLIHDWNTRTVWKVLFSGQLSEVDFVV
jgi:hypothetical protein